MSDVLTQVRDYFLNEEKDSVASVFTVAGFNFAGPGQNSGLAFVRMKPWGERPGDRHNVKALARRAMGRFSQIKDAMVFAFVPPAAFEPGHQPGFAMQSGDRAHV